MHWAGPPSNGYREPGTNLRAGLALVVLADLACCVAAGNGLRQLLTSFECLHDDGQIETRMCNFSNIAIGNGKLLYLYSGQPQPQAPEMLLDWNEPQFLSSLIEYVDVSQPKSSSLWDLPVENVDQAVFIVLPGEDNFYHGMAESSVAYHMKACGVFGHCSKATLPGPRLFRLELTNDRMGFPERYPPVEFILKCISPERPLHPISEALHDKVVLIKSAVIGIGPENRFHPRITRDQARFHQVYKRPDVSLMNAFRARVSECLNTTITDIKGDEPLNLTVIQRADDNGRHFTNIASIMAAIRWEFRDKLANVRLLRPHELRFEEQFDAYASSSIIILTHGAAMSNLMFMPKRGAIIEYVWHSEMSIHHEWTTDIIQDFDLESTFIGLHSPRPEDAEWMKELHHYVITSARLDFARTLHSVGNEERFIYTEKWAELSSADQVSFLLDRDIAWEKLDGMDRFRYTNFRLEWEVLRPAIEHAIHEIRHGKHTIAAWGVPQGAGWISGSPIPSKRGVPIGKQGSDVMAGSLRAWFGLG